jgi:hypothetical protein
MGLTMEFRAGPSRELAKAFCAAEFDRLEAISRVVADFSLHLSPNDLDLLAMELSDISRHPVLAFTDVVDGPIAGDDAECGAFLVSEGFVSMVASVPEGSASDIAERWMARVSGDSGEQEIAATADTVMAISELLRLCRTAKEEGLEVVYCWSL